MVDAVLRALGQMFTRPFHKVLLKAVGLAVAFLIAIVVVLFRLLEWLSGVGMNWLEVTIGPMAHGPLAVLAWVLAVVLGIGLFTGAVMLMPAVTALVASFFADEIAALVEEAHYPTDPPGTALPLWLAIMEGTTTALLAIAVYVCAVPLLLFAGAGAVSSFSPTRGCWAVSISILPRCVSIPCRKSERCAATTRVSFTSAACSLRASSRSRFSISQRRYLGLR